VTNLAWLFSNVQTSMLWSGWQQLNGVLEEHTWPCTCIAHAATL